MARPVEWTDEIKAALLAEFFVYIEENDIPIVAEFAYKHGTHKQRLYEWPEFADAIRLCVTKKEANLEGMGLTRQIDVGMAKFSLAQLGWTEKQEIGGPDKGPIGFRFVDAPNTGEAKTAN